MENLCRTCGDKFDVTDAMIEQRQRELTAAYGPTTAEEAANLIECCPECLGIGEPDYMGGMVSFLHRQACT